MSNRPWLTGIIFAGVIGGFLGGVTSMVIVASGGLPKWARRDASPPAPRGPFKLKTPDGWMAVGAAVSHDMPRWAERVREPKSGIELILVRTKSGIEPILVRPVVKFQMGSPAEEAGHRPDETQHPVELEAFYLGETEVTVGQWRRYVVASGYMTEAQRSGGGYTMQSNSRVAAARWDNPIPAFQYARDDQHPVTQVSWNDARSFCEHFGFELPSEAQWEYACRAGTSSEYTWGEAKDGGMGRGNFADQSAMQWYSGVPVSIRKSPDSGVFPFDDTYPFTAPVAQCYAPNAWGFHDMLGNVREWCHDGYRSDYENLNVKNPLHEAEATRVLRGSSWSNYLMECRAAARSWKEPSYCSDSIGFRVARTIPPSHWAPSFGEWIGH